MIPGCPNCRRALEWVTTYVSTGDGTERPLWESADCPCGLRLEYDPNQTHLVAARDAARMEAEERERERGQLELI